MPIVLFAVFPYVAVVTALAGSIGRYARNRYSYSSLSSQLLENERLFWGSVPWHYGIVAILVAHLLAWLFPPVALAILGRGYQLISIETLGVGLALYALVGLVFLVARRLGESARPRRTTSEMDWIVLVLLLVQVITGILIAVFDRWGSLWYLSTAVPWLWSLVKLQPDVSTVASLPALIQFHIVVGFLLIFLFPMTRLVHIAVPPITYLWRPYQVVIWRRGPGRRDLLSPGVLMASAPTWEPPLRPSHEAEQEPRAAMTSVDSGEITRRGFLEKVSAIVGAVGALLVAIPAVAFLLGLRETPQVWATVGRVDDFALGDTKQVAFADPSPLPWAGVTAQTAAWLRRDGAEQFTAFAMNCTHLGCPVRWIASANLFMCPCHGGVFYKDGQVASGPPPAPLTTYPVRVRDGQVQILTSPLPISGR